MIIYFFIVSFVTINLCCKANFTFKNHLDVIIIIFIIMSVLLISASKTLVCKTHPQENRLILGREEGKLYFYSGAVIFSVAL